MRPMRATPPTTPPTMAPTGVDLGFLVGAGTTDVVVVCGSVSDAASADFVSVLVIVGCDSDDSIPSLRVVVTKLAFFWPWYVNLIDCTSSTDVDAHR
jgi:hypothetical protein